jgi:heme-degrading monooxygenase HmoA
MTAYTYLWEFTVAAEQRAEFAHCYGQAGPWVALFRRAAGYRGTLLLHDEARPERFLTVDRWESEAAYRAFLAAFAREYAELDARCASLTRAESPLGNFREA